MGRKSVQVYKIINNPNPREMNTVRLLKEPYKGVEYAYGNLKFEKVQGEPIVRFIYEVFKNPNNLDLDNDKNFKTLISEILDEILEVAFREDGTTELDFATNGI